MSRLATVTDYQREIAEIDAILSAAETAEGESLAVRLANMGLRNRRASLLNEMADLDTRGRFAQEFDVFLDGEPVIQHTVEANFLAVMLNDLQGLARDLLADTLGRLGRSGPLAASIRDRSVLRVATTFAGSFGVRFEVGVGEFHLDDAGSVAESLGTLLNLIDAAPDDVQFVEAFEPLSARAKNKFRTLLDHVGGNGANVRIEWPTPRGLRKSSLAGRQACERLRTLDRFEESSHFEHITGILDSAVHSRATFLIITDEKRRIAGTIEEHLVDEMGVYWGKRVAAVLSVRELVKESGEKTLFYRLSKIELLPESESG